MKRFFVGAVAVLACAYACDSSPQSHVYVASIYIASLDCFGPSTSLGYIQTPDGNLDCAPTCLVSNTTNADGTNDVYVSTMCGPYPPNFDTTQTNASCAPVLVAWDSAGGAGSCVSDDEDAGEDTGAGEDAGEDAPFVKSDDAGGADDASDDGSTDAGDAGPIPDGSDGGD